MTEWTRVDRGSVLLASIVALALVARVTVVAVPGVADRLPVRPYSRAIHYQVAAEEVRAGEPVQLNMSRCDRVADAWRAEETFLPPDANTFPIRPEDHHLDFYDERGYLLLTLGTALATGRVAYIDLLLLQSAISAAVVGAVGFAARTSLGLPIAAAVTLVLALHPLDLMLVAMPDVPMWAVAATGLSAAVLLGEPSRLGGGAVTARLVVGAAVGFACVLRAPTLAVAAALLAGLVFARGRRGAVEAAIVAAGMAISIGASALFPLELPTVGRAEFWHTLLAGLSETGRVPGLEWDDKAIDRYLLERHGVALGDPGFSAAAKIEYISLLREDPLLPARVIAERAGRFVIGYRPGKESMPYLLAIGVTKVAGFLGSAAWIARTRGAARRRAIAVIGVVLATLLAHLAIVPLLEVYVAASFIGMLAIGTGALAALIPSTPDPAR